MASQRMKGITIERPIVYGSIAFPLGKKAEEGKTHKWICFVRGVNNEDISVFIKKVQFTLHPSFPNPKRVVERFPFEVHESGWGEFEIGIRLFFVDPSEKPIDLYHPLKLYPPEGQLLNPKKPVVLEFYDEIVFNQPKEELYNLLMSPESQRPPMRPSKYLEYFNKFNEETELNKLVEVQKKLKIEIQQLREKYDQLEVESTQILKDIQAINNGETVAITPYTPKLPSQPQDTQDKSQLSYAAIANNINNNVAINNMTQTETRNGTMEELEEEEVDDNYDEMDV